LEPFPTVSVSEPELCDVEIYKRIWRIINIKSDTPTISVEQLKVTSTDVEVILL
jgi:hypothetical protein